MSTQILPYSAAEFNEILKFAESEKIFQLRRGEEFVLSTLRLLLLEHKLQDVFGIVLLHSQDGLKEHEKLVSFNNSTSPWTLVSGEKLIGEAVLASKWRILKGRGIMPYTFEYRYLGFNNTKDIDLAHKKYQPFLEDFVNAVETGRLHDVVGLTLRPEQPTGMEINQENGRSKLFLPKGTYNPEQVGRYFTVAWYFNTKTSEASEFEQKQPIERRYMTLI